MEDESREDLDYPYYEATYLDDDNNRHLVKIKSNSDLNFYRDRFDNFEYSLVNIL